MTEPTYMPIGLDVSGRRALIVGGGAVAARKARQLLDAGARIRVIAPQCCQELIEIITESSLAEMLNRTFAENDVSDADIVFAATNQPETNAEVVRTARKNGVLVCDTSDAIRGDFILPSIARSGVLTLAVMSDGLSPSLSRDASKAISESLPEEIRQVSDMLHALRADLREWTNDASLRRHILRQFAGENLIVRVRETGYAETLELLRASAKSMIQGART